MNKVILSAVAGIAVGYFFRKIRDKAHLQEANEEINGAIHKDKKHFRNILNKDNQKANE
ncbi:hypothetical protein [Prevotella sp. 10(H)]|uniref:hypothetical protein n=1 Tax=Prevotella sp. 10(H) TaxID=1158294 RepID=UPI000ADF3663|nr:hypothetical protein [Prevotella sp. 10(H)]